MIQRLKGNKLRKDKRTILGRWSLIQPGWRTSNCCLLTLKRAIFTPPLSIHPLSYSVRLSHHVSLLPPLYPFKLVKDSRPYVELEFYLIFLFWMVCTYFSFLIYMGEAFYCFVFLETKSLIELFCSEAEQQSARWHRRRIVGDIELTYTLQDEQIIWRRDKVCMESWVCQRKFFFLLQLFYFMFIAVNRMGKKPPKENTTDEGQHIHNIKYK